MPFSPISAAFLDDLTARAERSQRLRQHHNLHADYDDPVQRLFNAIGMDSYIRPHRHGLDPKTESLIAVRGRLALIAFSDAGAIVDCVPFGMRAGDAAGVEVQPEQWHTVIALEPSSILFEVKPGPFDPGAAKEPAPWSPMEGGADASAYLARLRTAVLARDAWRQLEGVAGR